MSSSSTKVVPRLIIRKTNRSLSFRDLKHRRIFLQFRPTIAGNAIHRFSGPGPGTVRDP